MSKTGSGRMPHLGSQLVDPEGTALIEEWIESLPVQETTSAAPANETAAKRQAEERHLLEQLKSAGDARADERSALVDRLLSTTGGALLLVRAVDRKLLPLNTAAIIVQKGTSRADVPVRDLFEKFLPEEKRVKRLGSAVRPEQILRLAGEAARGRRVFFDTEGVQCKNCHRIQNTGREVGPDLDAIGKKSTPARLLESILEPSKIIDPKYVTYVVETKSGKLFTGLLLKKDAAEVVLKDAEDKQVRVPAGEVERLVGQQASLMPELQVRDLTAQQVADLIAYLGSLK
jgi:putative heme-binding domain-containing protein